MKKVKVTVIIPVYNVEKYIDKCLTSLVKQTLKEIEIIVVNDGSPDNSQKIIDKFVKKYPDKVKSYIKENGGQGSARNFGLEKATGEYIGYVDSDDFIETDMYEKLYNKAKENNYDIVFCGNYDVYEDSEVKKEESIKFKHSTDIENAIFDKIAVWNKIYKRNILVDNKIQFRSKVWYEDLDFTLKSIISSKKIGYVNEPLYDYLIREGSTMNNSNIERNLEILLAFDNIVKDKKSKEYFDIIEFLAVDNIYISTIVRIIRANANKKRKLEIIKKLIYYMNINFPNFKKNKYISSLSRNRMIIYKLINLKMYSVIKLIFKVKKVRA